MREHDAKWEIDNLPKQDEAPAGEIKFY